MILHIFDPELLTACLEEFPTPDAGWRRYGNGNECKMEGPPEMWGPATRDYFTELGTMAEFFSELFDIPDLTLETIGGGYHLIPPGGYLNVHTDFSRSPQTGLYRRLNVLTYLNDWLPGDGGELEMWDLDGLIESIPPKFGYTAAFETSATSWHGHPNPTRIWRASLAGYFFSPACPDGFVEQSTVWHPKAVAHA